MVYDPVTYWGNRTDLKDRGSKDWVEAYIRMHTLPGRILDYGTGTGSKIHLFEGMSVVGMDIVDTYRQRAKDRAKDLDLQYIHIVSDRLDAFAEDEFDTVLCSKVLLHVPDLTDVAKELNRVGQRVIVWDIDREDGAEHVFNHDFSQYFDMKDVIRKDEQILFHT